MDRKAESRAALKALRASLSPAERERASAAASHRLLAWVPRTATTVALYAAFGDEIDPAAAVAGLRERGVRVLLPRVDGDAIELAEAVGELTPGPFGVLEPAGPASDLADVDVVVLPGLGFTTDGARLGRGGGHYDRLLVALPDRTVRVGLCFEVQVVADLPVEDHDQRVDVVITER